MVQSGGILKYGHCLLRKWLSGLFNVCDDERKNAMIVALHKEESNKSECKNYVEGDNQTFLGIHLAEF